MCTSLNVEFRQHFCSTNFEIALNNAKCTLSVMKGTFWRSVTGRPIVNYAHFKKLFVIKLNLFKLFSRYSATLTITTTRKKWHWMPSFIHSSTRGWNISPLRLPIFTLGWYWSKWWFLSMNVTGVWLKYYRLMTGCIDTPLICLYTTIGFFSTWGI